MKTWKIIINENWRITSTYPKPDTSGIYLPQPNKGGTDKDSEYIQIAAVILKAVEKDDIFPSKRWDRIKLDSLQIDNTQSVIIETNPEI